MLLSICIVNWNTTDLLIALLESINKFPPRCEYEVIVVDNASLDFDEPKVKSVIPELIVVSNQSNNCYAKGNNQAYEVAGGKYLLLLNPDIEATEGALDNIISFIVTHSDAAAVGAKLIRPDGEVDPSVRSFPTPIGIASEFLGFSKLFPNSILLGSYRMRFFDYNKTAEVDQPMGSALIISRSVLDKIGPFDEQFPIFFNEVDWLYRAKNAGYKTYYYPEAVFIHHGGEGTSKASRRKMLAESHESLVRFYRKHYKGSINPILYWFVIICIRMGLYVRR